MHATALPIGVYTPLADLDLLLAEEELDSQPLPPAPARELSEPDRVDAFIAQILAGLVSP